jgi:murein DD-endopeptidase MepM/ murein hydrolase activator NlpD
MICENEQSRARSDGLTVVAIAFIIFFVFNILKDRGNLNASDLPQGTNITAKSVRREESLIDKPILDPANIAWPYDHYSITQGPHGSSYGHLAIDLSAGKGATIRSPLNGSVSDRYIDQWGNPTLVIENELYQVMLLHGEYTVQIGDPVTIGQPIGIESNIGYTTDMQGIPCNGRACGYHTHLNIYDKRLGSNVNPLDLLAEKN